MPHSWQCQWNDAQIALLTELWMSGRTSGDCAAVLGVSRSAAIGKLSRLGMLRRPRPKLPSMPHRKPAQLLETEQQVLSKPPQKPRIRQNKRPLPPPEPYQAPQRPPDPPIGSFDLLQLRHGHCRWPSAGDGPKWTFCGMPRAGESSYCSEHHALAHHRGSQRDYDRMAEQALAGKLFASRAGVME